MSFQWVFDTAEQIAMNNRPIVGQTITRNQTVRAVSKGPGIQKFTVTLPDGLEYDKWADEIAALDAASTFAVETVRLNNPGYSDWINAGSDYNVGDSWNVMCVEMPTWNIFQRNQVEWSGSFVFYESII